MNKLTIQRGYLSLKHLAEWADVSPKTIQRWIEGGLPFYQGTVGGKVLVRPEDIHRFLQKRQVAQVDIETMVNETLREIELGASSRPAPGKGVQRQPSAC